MSTVKRQVKLTQWSFPCSKLTLQWSLPPSHYFLMLSRASTTLSRPPQGGRNLNKTKRDFGKAQSPFLYLTEIISCKDKANGWNMKSSFIMNYL